MDSPNNRIFFFENYDKNNLSNISTFYCNLVLKKQCCVGANWPFASSVVTMKSILLLEGCVCLVQDCRVNDGDFGWAYRSSVYTSSGFSLKGRHFLNLELIELVSLIHHVSVELFMFLSSPSERSPLRARIDSC